MSDTEQTLSIIKPDAVERNLEEPIKELFIKNSFKIVKQKKVQLDKKEARLAWQEYYTTMKNKYHISMLLGVVFVSLLNSKLLSLTPLASTEYTILLYVQLPCNVASGL